jgi:5S rRNA maturation endonuclease (ribonuclease M5)
MSFIDYIRKLANDESIQTGKKIKCLNPDHTDTDPSFHVYEDHAYCFSCGYYIRENQQPKKIDIKTYAISKFIEYCKGEEPTEFIGHRRYNKERIKKLGIGFASSDVYSKLIDEFQYFNLKKAKLVDAKGRHTYVGRTIIPFNKTYFSARRNISIKDDKQNNLFPGGLTKPPYVIDGEKSLIICEGEPDAIALHHIFSENKILAVCGVAGVDKKLDFYLSHRTDKQVIICFDNDRAGLDALNAVKKEINKYPDLDFKQLKFYENKDVDEVFRKYGQSTLNEIEIVPLVAGVGLEDLEPDEQELLTEPTLLNRIVEKVNESAVGENNPIRAIILSYAGASVVNKAATSYHIMLNDSAGAGKDHITASALNVCEPKFIVREDGRVIYRSKISPQAFTYWHSSKSEPDWSWNGRILYLEDISKKLLTSEVFKVMLSGGSQATVVINQKATDIEIKGKPQVICSMAHGTPNDEMLRRFFLMQIDCSGEQTRNILRKIAENSREKVESVTQDDVVGRSLKALNSVHVNVPYALELADAMPNNLYMRTHFNRFLDFIKASACLHQFQRERNGQFVEANEKDYELVKTIFEYSATTAGMTPIPKSLKEILDLFEQLEPTLDADSIEEGIAHYSVSTLECKAPFGNTELYKRLNSLVQMKLLLKKKYSDPTSSSKKAVAVFAVDKSKMELKLPTFDEINNTSMNSAPSSQGILGKSNDNNNTSVINGIDENDKSDESHGNDGNHGSVRKPLIRWDDNTLSHIPCSKCGRTPCNQFNNHHYCKEHFVFTQEEILEYIGG